MPNKEGASVLLLPLLSRQPGRATPGYVPNRFCQNPLFFKSMNEYISYSFSFLLLVVWECTPWALVSDGAGGPWRVALHPDS